MTDPTGTAATRVYLLTTTDGITTVLVAFQLACLLFPRTIKHRQQFFASFWLTVALVLLYTLRLMLADSAGMQVFGGVIVGVVQSASLVLLFLSCGGFTVGQFVDEMKDAYAVMRRGGTTKEYIVPLTGDQPKPRVRADEDIGVPPSATPVVPPSPAPPRDLGAIPLDE